MPDGLKSFWKKRAIEPLLAQLTQAVTPHHLALSCALGTTIGIFPIWAFPTAMYVCGCVLLTLNQTAIQTVNYLLYPVHIVLIPVFVRAGEKLFAAEPVPFSPSQLIQNFSNRPIEFLKHYG